MRVKRILLIAGFTLCTGCFWQTKALSDTNNLCTIFKERKSWYKAARNISAQRGADIATMMAFIYQESHFKAKAKPARLEVLGVKLWRKSTSYGFSQAKKTTWDWYRKKAKKPKAKRHRFKDSLDFIAWYNQMSGRLANIPSRNVYQLYLAYHEGHRGYLEGSYKKKKWLIGIAKKVNNLAKKYQKQLKRCNI